MHNFPTDDAPLLNGISSFAISSLPQYCIWMNFRYFTTSFNAKLITSGIILIQINLVFIQVLIICIRLFRQENPLKWRAETGSKLERTFHKRVRNFFTKLTSIAFSHNGYTSPPIPALLQTISRHPNVSLTFLNKSK